MARLPFEASSTSCPASVSPRTRPRRSASWSSAIRIRPIVSAFLLFEPARSAGHRQGDAKSRAGARLAVHVNPPIVRVYDFSNNRQAETGALRLGGEKRIEDLLGHVRLQAGSVVHDFDDH